MVETESCAKRPVLDLNEVPTVIVQYESSLNRHWACSSENVGGWGVLLSGGGDAGDVRCSHVNTSLTRQHFIYVSRIRSKFKLRKYRII